MSIPFLTPNVHTEVVNDSEVLVRYDRYRRRKLYYEHFGKDLMRAILDSYWVVFGKGEKHQEMVKDLQFLVFDELSRMKLVSGKNPYEEKEEKNDFYPEEEEEDEEEMDRP